MSLTARFVNLSAEDYLALEEQSDVRHEFVNGQMFAMTDFDETVAMAGSSDAHNLIALNIAAILRQRLRGTGCRAYIFDMKARVEKTDDFYYPDVTATCEKFVAKSLFKSRPFLIVEVLSPRTIRTDRREKLATYRLIDELREYVIVYQEQKRVELCRKDQRGAWQFWVLSEGDEVVLESLPNGALTLTMDEIYEDVDWEADEAE
jgi:Uma2 family endonuclease